jgi:hypothetical protein
MHRKAPTSISAENIHVSKFSKFFQPDSSCAKADSHPIDIPPREMLLSPILPERSLAMLYAPRGMGKSILSLSIGLSVAAGAGIHHWGYSLPCWLQLLAIAPAETRLASRRPHTGRFVAGERTIAEVAKCWQRIRWKPESNLPLRKDSSCLSRISRALTA